MESLIFGWLESRQIPCRWMEGEGTSAAGTILAHLHPVSHSEAYPLLISYDPAAAFQHVLMINGDLTFINIYHQYSCKIEPHCIENILLLCSLLNKTAIFPGFGYDEFQRRVYYRKSYLIDAGSRNAFLAGIRLAVENMHIYSNSIRDVAEGFISRDELVKLLQSTDLTDSALLQSLVEGIDPYLLEGNDLKIREAHEAAATEKEEREWLMMLAGNDGRAFPACLEIICSDEVRRHFPLEESIKLLQLTYLFPHLIQPNYLPETMQAIQFFNKTSFSGSFGYDQKVNKLFFRTIIPIDVENGPNLALVANLKLIEENLGSYGLTLQEISEGEISLEDLADDW